MTNWLGKHPTPDTPAGATYHFNRAKVLSDCVVVGFGILEDRENEGEFVINLLLAKPNSTKQFALTAWVDEERTRPGWLEIVDLSQET